MSARSSSHAKTRTPAAVAPRPAAGKRRGKAHAARHPRLSRLLAWLLSALLGGAGLAYAQVPANTLPTGGQVVVGSAQLQQGSHQLIVNQATPRLGIDWQSFSIGSGATVEFRQPGSDSVALNRIVGDSGSEIYGRLRANGQVFLVNPRGVLFAPGSKADVGGLVASTLDITQADFAAGRYHFQGNGSGSVVNQGTLRASSGGYLALLGQQVANEGEITVDRGSVVLASGRAATVSISGNGLLSAVVNGGEGGRVANSGRIEADGSLVRLDARSAEGLAASLVNNSGIVRATSMVERNGEIWITGDQVSHSGSISADASGALDAGRVSIMGSMAAGGTLAVSGSVSAQAEGGRGGAVETSAALVAVAPSARVNTLSASGQHGTWTIDPTDFTVSSGGGAQTTSGIGADTLRANLNLGNVALATASTGSEAGDIHVNADVTWTTATTLTLTAIRDINVNAPIGAASGSGSGLVANAGRNINVNANVTVGGSGALTLGTGSGGNFNVAAGSRVGMGTGATLTINNVGYTLIRDYTALQALDSANSLAGNFALANDIDATASGAANNGLGFNPIGNETTNSISTANSFSGRFQGLGHTITGLTVARPAANTVGLFATTNGARIDNLTLSGGSFSGSQFTGSVVGVAAGTTQLANVRSGAAVSSVDDSSSGVWAGGLVGYLGSSGTQASIRDSAATGAVSADTNTSTARVGGLVGEQITGNLASVSASGAVSATARSGGSGDGSHHLGGLVGQYTSPGGSITLASASGNVTGGRISGGLVGYMVPGSGTLSLADSQASGNVTGTGHAGGLVGQAGAGTVSNADATGNVTSTAPTGSFDVGGAIGLYQMGTAPVDLTARGNVSSTGNTAGGVIGYYNTNAALTATSIVSVAPLSGTKTVTGGNWAGGLIGYSSSTASITGLSAGVDVTTTGTSGAAAGLIGRTAGAVSDSSATGRVNGAGDAGGLIGRAEGTGALNNLQATGNVATTSTASSVQVGGLIGYVTSGTLSNSTASGSVTGGYFTGGLVGQFSPSGNLSDSSASGNVSNTISSYIGGLVGYASGTGSFSGVSASGNVTAGNSGSYTGGLVGQFSKPGGMSNATATGNVTGGNRVGGLVGYYASGGNLANGNASGNVSANLAGATYAGGLVGDFVNSGTMTGSLATGTVRGTYAGGLVGSYHQSGNASTLEARGTVVGDSYAGGLFGIWQNSGTLTDSRSSGNAAGVAYTGGLIGYASGNAGINNVTVTGSANGRSYVGGLAGYLNTTPVTLAVARGNVSAISDGAVYAGGLLGEFAAQTTQGISQSRAEGTVTVDAASTVYIGGLVGLYSGGTVSQSSAVGNVTATDSVGNNNFNQFSGGLVGYFSSGTIADSTASGMVVGRYMSGGLVGYYGSTNSVTNSSASGNVVGTEYAGGLLGYMNRGGVVTGVATGNVTASSINGHAGGLVGYAQTPNTGTGTQITDSRASGSVTGGTYAGGLVGYMYDFSVATVPTLSNSSASGAVSARLYAGGLVGYWDWAGSSSATNRHERGIRSSFATGNVQATLSIGGLVGVYSSHGGIQDSFATGNVLATGTTSEFYLGGLVGRFNNLNTTAGNGQILRSYASGSVALSSTPTVALGASTNVYAGGLVGYSDGATAALELIADSYATGSVTLGGTAGRLRTGGLVGFTDASMARVYATGAVSGALPNSFSAAGGLVAARSTTSSVATNSFWATDSTGQAGSAMGTASTTAGLRTASTFSSWGSALSTTGGSSATWRIYDGNTAPLIRSLLTPLTISLADINKVYDGTTGLGSGTISINGVAVTNPDRILAAGLSPNAGTYQLTPGNLYSVQSGYDLVFGTGATATLTVARRPLTLDGLVQDKVYDGSTAATLASNPRLGGLVAGESLTFQPGGGFAATFANKNVGTDKTVNLSGSYTLVDGPGGLASNYLLPTALSTTADITPATLTAGSFAAASRVYDGTNVVAITATSATPVGVMPGDTVNVDLSGVTSGTMADKNVGTGKAVTVLGAQITGADAGNYVLAGINNVSVNITPRLVTVNGLTGVDRAYIGGNSGTGRLTVSVDGTNATLANVVSGDVVVPRVSALGGTMADKNVGNDKPVTVTGLALRGPDAPNYTVQAGPTTVDITPYQLTVSLGHTTSSSRVYDGTTNANTFWFTTWYGGDSITVNATSIGYADKNVAYNSSGNVISKTITANGITLSGSDIGNYTLLNTTATLSGTITPKPLAVSGVTAVDRVYDASRNVTVNISGATVDTTAVVPGDVVGVSTPGSGTVTGLIADKNVGTSKPVTVPGLSLTGADAGNYSITSGTGGGVTVNITRKDITASYAGIDKVYDGNAFAALNVTSSDIISGDVVNFFADNSWCTQCGYGYFTVAGFTSPNNYTTSRHAGSNIPVVITTNGLYGTDAANYRLLNPTGQVTASITPKPITLSFDGGTRVYDGSTAAPAVLNRGQSGIFSVDTIDTTVTATFTGTNAKDVGQGNKPFTVSAFTFGGTDAGNYTVASTATSRNNGTVTPKPVLISGITATDRAYNGSTAVGVTAGNVGSAGFVPGDVVSVSLPPGGLSTGTIANANVGTAKPVTVTGLSLTGTDAPNYLIDTTASGITVNITPAQLTPTYASVSREYNGGVAVTVTSTTSGIVSGDTVTFSQQAVFSGAGARDAGTNKPISISNIAIGGASAANYSLASTTASTTGTITPKGVNITYTGGSRVYNGVADVSANVVGNSLQFVAGDSVGLTQTAVFGDGNAGTNKPVSISNIALTGTHAANYTLLTSTTSTTATITPRPLGVTGITASNRTYDGTTSVAVNLSNASVDTSNVVAGDSVSFQLPPGGISTGTMADRHAGASKPVSITGIALAGSSAANYQLVGATGLTVSIAPLAITASYTGGSRVYDGGADAPITASSSGVLSIDAAGVGFSAQGNFASGKNVGDNLPITVSSAFLTGSFRENYALVNPTGSTTGSITPKPVTASFGGVSRVYDGTTNATVNGTVVGAIAGDQIGTTQTASFADKNVGNSKLITVGGVQLTGADLGNYTLTGTSGGAPRANITPKPITVSGLSNVTATDRVYDGTRTVSVVVPAGVTLTPNSSDIIAGDVVQIGVPGSGTTTGTMVDKHVGTGKAVVVDGLSLSGADAGNYSVAGTAGVLVNITPLAINATWAGVNRVYNGGLAATATGSSAAVISGDLLTISGSGVFTDGKNVGTAKPVNITGATLSGSDARNYTLLTTTGSTTADVTPLTVTPTFSGGSRVYDGLVAAPVTATTSFFAGDSVTLGGSAVFTGSGAKNVGNNKPVSVTGLTLSGADSANYRLGSSSAATTATITPRPLTLLGLTGVVANDRAYDGTTSVQVTVNSTGGTVSLDRSNVIAGDNVDVAQLTGNLTTGTMADKNVGTSKPVAVTGLALTGTDAPNYTVAATAGVTVNITPRLLTATFTGQDKVYDGTNAATVLGTSAGIVSGDSVTITGSGVFAAGKNVGTGLTVNVTGGLLSGSDAFNYLLTSPNATTTASITPRSVSATYVGSTRVYDGGTSAPVTGTLSGLVAGDAVTLGQTAVFTGAGARNVGVNKPVTVSGLTLAGTDAGNYLLSTSGATVTATITPKPLGVIGLTGVTAVDRTYDGTTSVVVNVGTTGTVTLNTADIVPGDSVSISAPSAGQTTGTLQDKNAGSNKPVAVTGLALSGADAGNYSVATTSGVTVNIAPKNLNATFTAQDKVYDGTNAATLLGSSADIVSGDTVLLAASGVFAAGKNVGTNLVVTFTGATLGGADALNYLLTNPSGSTTASITPRTLTATYSGGSRVYDGTFGAPVTRTLTGLIAGDTVGASETAAFAGTLGKDAGDNKPVTITGITLSGTDAGNYLLVSDTASTTASVTRRSVTVSGITGITAVDREYDGTTSVQLSGSPTGIGTLSNVIGADNVGVSISGGGFGSGQMADKNAGQNKPVALSGLFLSGSDAHNYQLTGVAGVTVNIARRTVTVTGLSAVDRIYDGTSTVAINTSGGSLTGALPGDSVSLLSSGATASMSDRNAGQGKVVNIGGLTMGGADAANYQASSSTTVTVNIAPRTLNAGVTGADKVYDGTTGATVAFTDDRVAGDTLALSATSASFASANAGSGIGLTVNGITLAGADAGNYVLGTSLLTTSANILRRNLQVTANSLTKVYGTAYTFAGNEFSVASGNLVAGETLGQLALSSGGAAATAGVGSSPYAITAGTFSGGSANLGNYNLSLVDGSFTVTPRTVNVATNSVARFANEGNPGSWAFSVGSGDLLGSDRITAVNQIAPAGSAGAPGGSVFTLLPGGVTFAPGVDARNYAVRFSPGLLVVLPTPPQPGDFTSGDGDGGTDGFALDPALVALGDRAAGEAGAARQGATVGSRPLPRSGLGGGAAAVESLTPEELAALLAGDGRRITLPTLRRLPLISFDPQLQRVLEGTR
jgi:trimeric autotransporter adhesin